MLATTRRRNLTLTDNGRRFHLESFTDAETLALFDRILGEEYAAKEKDVLRKIANALWHLPLAVDIVACRLAYEPGWTAADFGMHLQHENSLLNNLVYEERCVRSAFTVSYDQLTPEQQRFFAALGAFGGEDFSVEAAWRRLIDYYVTYIARHENEIDVLDVERNNIPAALAAAREWELSDALERGLNAFSYFLQQRGLSRLDLESVAH